MQRLSQLRFGLFFERMNGRAITFRGV